MKKPITPMEFVVSQAMKSARPKRTLPRVPKIPDEQMIAVLERAGGINKGSKILGMSSATFSRRMKAILAAGPAQDAR